MINKRTKELYDLFYGLPNNAAIVRQNQENDAFVLVAFEILFKNFHNKQNFTKQDLDFLQKYVVPPPDDGIDIFYEYVDGDDSIYHIVQVKKRDLAEHEISESFAYMNRTIKTYLKNPKNVNKNVQNIIGNTEFDVTNEPNCIYYVVHTGEINQLKSLRKNERIIRKIDLEILSNSIQVDCVPKETFTADSINNFILYRYLDDPASSETPKALLCNLNGYDLANFTNKYINTELGRNILFGMNLRESLEKESKTLRSMTDTINTSPSKFWYFNNGITIIAEEFDVKQKESIEDNKVKVEKVTLKNFSIINGAQTASALGTYLRDAKLDKNNDNIEKLKKVHVLTRIVETKKDTDLRNDIAVYNNTQNPISTRDMASVRSEQIYLNKWLMNTEKPQIYVEIRRGQNPPNSVQLLKHQRITNEVLAQLCLAGFCKNPSIAKDKKNALFNNEFKEEFNLNEFYHKIFNYDTSASNRNGLIYRKSKNEIEELLFVNELYNESRKSAKNRFNTRLQNSIDNGCNENDSDVAMQRRLIEIVNNCRFYTLGLYFEFKDTFHNETAIKSFQNNLFDYKCYYNKKENYRAELLSEFEKLFLVKTIDIIYDASGNSNVNNWIRLQKNESIFLTTLKKDLAIKLEFLEKYKTFVEKFKIIK